MKKFTIFCSAMFALSTSASLFAQDRGARYNPSPSRSSSPSSSSSSRGPSYSPSPSRSSSPSSSSSSRGPSYNPTPGSSSPSVSAPSGPHYNPSRGVPAHEAGRLVRRTVFHSPFSPPFRVIRFNSPRDYHVSVQRRYIYRSWIQEPVSYSYTDGYWNIDGHPYYVSRGFRYRYNPVEMCQYQLVDGDSYTMVKDFGLKACTEAYDECAIERDGLNHGIGMERYFCAEAVEPDLQSTTTEGYSSSPADIDEAKLATINQFLTGKTLQDIFSDGLHGGVGECLIYSLRGNENGCRYIVTASDEYFPDAEGNICSSSHVAAQVGCNVGSESENAGCILEKAIREGLCHR